MSLVEGREAEKTEANGFLQNYSEKIFIFSLS